MSNIAEQEQLVEVLKFTPTEVTVYLVGYGGEIVLGKVDPKVVEYFEENELDIEEYANNWDNEMEVPEKMQPFAPGEWHDCDNIVHEYGVELHNSCRIIVEDAKGQVIWEHHLGIDELLETGVNINCGEEFYASAETGPVFFGQTTEKGGFFDGTFTLRAPFDPSKLTLDITDVEGWELCAGVSYDDEYIDNNGNSSTDGKGSSFRFLNVEGE